MPAQNNNDTEKSFYQGADAGKKIADAGIAGAKNAAKNGKTIAKGAKTAAKAGVKAGKAIAEAVSKLAEALAALGPVGIFIIIVAIFVILIVVAFNSGWLRIDKAYLEEEDYHNAYTEITEIVEDEITSAHKKVHEEAEKICEEYIEENFDDHESRVEYMIMEDSPETVARHITPYIMGVHSSIQYDVNNHGLLRYMEIGSHNEYNQIRESFFYGRPFQDAIKKYAETGLFYLDSENLIDDTELITEERTVYDELTGLPKLDIEGNEITEEVEVYVGTISVGIGYYIGDYKKDDIEEAVDNIYENRHKGNETSREQYAEWVEEWTYDIIEDITGTREYSLWGGYGQGILALLHMYDDFDWDNLNMDLGTIEILLSLGEHGPMNDQALVELMKQYKGYLTNTLGPETGGWYCTAWAHLFMYLVYGRDYNCNPGGDGGDGNGANMAYTLALRNDEWYNPSDGVPTAGAIFSVKGINEGAGHVGMITKVEGNTVWWVDGNVGGSGYNTRLNQSDTLEHFRSRFGGPVEFANHK